MQEALDVLKKGGVILYPTDTVWGLGCDATNFEAVEKLSAIKKRVEGKSYIILINDDRKLNRYVKDVPNLAWDFIEFATKPTTIIYEEAGNIAKNVIAEDNSVGIRVVEKGFCHDLLRAFGKPLVSTSANLSGQPTPVNFNQINKSILEAVDYVVNLPAGEKLTGKPSTVIKLGVNNDYKLIRK